MRTSARLPAQREVRLLECEVADRRGFDPGREALLAVDHELGAAIRTGTAPRYDPRPLGGTRWCVSL